MSLESDWAVNKAIAKEKLEDLLALGIPTEVAREIARWNSSYDYETFAGMQDGSETPESGLRLGLVLRAARSPHRVNSLVLQDAVLDAGKLYAIFIPDVPELDILDITFKLNGSTVHQEFSTPWDYDGTAPGGDANRVTFVAGSYTIEAIANATGGPYSFEASFDVE